MNSKVQSLKAFLASAGRVALVEVAGTKGSTPREKGAFMLVSQEAIFGTIGGGQLEFMAIDKARQVLRHSGKALTLDIPLGMSVLHALSDAVASVADNKICPRLDAPATPERVLMAIERLKKETKASP